MKTLTPAEFKLAQEKLGFSNQQMADALDSSLSSVVKWRRGENEVNLILTYAIKYLLMKYGKIEDIETKLKRTLKAALQ